MKGRCTFSLFCYHLDKYYTCILAQMGDINMEVRFCGGSYEVGASCILLTIAGKRILFDCGIRMTGDALPNLEIIRQSGGLDLILVSRAHMDHIGALPIISNAFPQATIIMTHMTKELAKILLYDSLKIMDLREDDIPIFSEIHVENMLNRTLCYSPNYDIYPFLDDFEIRMYQAGHIPGAVCFYLVTQEGSFFYSGDFSMTPQLAVGGAAVGKLRPDVAILESTYGNRLHSSREQELAGLLKKIVETVESGNKILIPAFALGRAQEVLIYLNNAFAKKTAAKFPIYVDGMVNDIWMILEDIVREAKRSLSQIQPGRTVSRKLKNSRLTHYTNRKPCI